jgi:anaerobic selenocysteine-containing dehydrogenase
MLPEPKKYWTPELWASWKPFGLGEQYPNNYWEVLRAIWLSRDNFPSAWEVLNKGVCDGCALGTTGMKDWTLDGLHLCNVRLRLLRLNTMSEFDDKILSDVAPLKKKSSADLLEMGRLSYPMIRHQGDRGFTRISWDEALDTIRDRVRATTRDRLGLYYPSRHS